MKSWVDVHNRAIPKSASHVLALPEQPVSGGGDADKMRRRKMLFVGLLPPPVDGQRMITQRMLERFDATTTVACCNADRFPRLGPLSKLLSAIAACFVLLGARLCGYATLYLAPHSGTGLVYSCVIAWVSRCFGYELTVHYHSYRNLKRRSSLMATFIAICGHATHVVLAPPMARDLQRLYRGARRVVVVSNTIFVAPRQVARQFGARRLRIGHLSNLSREKGIGTVLQCMHELKKRGMDVELRLAGPAEDAHTSALIACAQAEFGESVSYLGRLGPREVARFYEEIDIFLFPTIHEHEAEPLVLIDAVSAGVPVIATDRGCISYLIGSAGAVLPAARFVDRAVEQIALWANSPDMLSDASDRARARFAEVHHQSQTQLDHLFASIFAEA
jgi:glycosyltransferase involved in cell wall biosynthesis